jgi:EAL domain
MPKRSANPLCFIVDEDFVFRQDLAKELRRDDIDTVEFSTSSRLIDMIEAQNPDIVLVNLNNAAPRECVRALLALKECRYAGAVQLFGHCEPKILESFKTIGLDSALAMLPPLQKPIKVATIHNILRDRKLGTAPAAAVGGVSLKDALSKNTVRFLYQPKLDLKTGFVVGAEAVARIAHPQLGLLSPDQFLKGADQEALLNLSRAALVDAIRASAHFHQTGIALQIAINISADNLLALPISDLALMHRPERGDWAGIILEVPERQVVNKIEALKTRAPKLQESGVSIAIDNFGRGSTSLTVLNQIPVLRNQN